MKKKSKVMMADSRSLANCSRTRSRIKWLCQLLILCVLIFPLSSQAADKSWTGQTGWWHDGTNWTTTGAPQDGDNAFLTQSDAINRDVNYAGTMLPSESLTSLTVSAYGTGKITLNIGSDLLPVDNEYIGARENWWEVPYDPNLTGTVTQTGGQHVVNGNLILGQDGTGTYNMNGGMLSSDDIYVGNYRGQGFFNQSDGVVEANALFLNERSEGYASDIDNAIFHAVYDLNGGSLITNHTRVGGWYQSTFDQSGGTHETERLLVGLDGDGWYNLSGGTLVADEVDLGTSSGTGTFTQTGGSFIVNDTLTIEAGTVNLLGGNLTAANIINDGYFYYSGGSLNVGVLNGGYTVLSGRGLRLIDGDVVNENNWESSNTSVSYAGNFLNSSNFASDNSIQYFNALTIDGDGAMTGSGAAPWFVADDLSGLSIADNTVTNIFGEDGFDVYYNPYATGNAYLGGMDYNLTQGGNLIALDGMATKDRYFLTDSILLGDQFTFDAWWGSDQAPDVSDLDLMVFYNDEWTSADWDYTFQDPSTQWETLTYSVPEWARGLETQVKLAVAALDPDIDPMVYLKNVRSITQTSVPEPSTMLLFCAGLIAFIGGSRKNSRKTAG